MSSDRPDSLKQREIHFLNGSTAKMQAGYFSVTEDTRGKGGYNIYYYCDECLSDNDSVKISIWIPVQQHFCDGA